MCVQPSSCTHTGISNTVSKPQIIMNLQLLAEEDLVWDLRIVFVLYKKRQYLPTLLSFCFYNQATIATTPNLNRLFRTQSQHKGLH